MAFTPDVPFPKSAGDPIRSKDWNDLVTETKRLDTAKVERAGDAITGNLSIAGALAVGKAAAAAGAKVDIAGGDLRIGDANLMLRGGTDNNHGLGWFGGTKLFAAANLDGPVLFGFSGGGLGTTSGGQKLALTWDTSGRVGVGVPSPTMRFEVGDRVRLRQGAAGDAGTWLYQTTPAEDRAFIGMNGDNNVGLWGNKGIGWGLQMDVTTGATGLRVAPAAAYSLFINPAAANGQPAQAYGLVIGNGATSYAAWFGGNVYGNGRVRDQKLRINVAAANPVNTTSASYVDLPNLATTVVSPDIGAYFHIVVQISGIQAYQGPTPSTIGVYVRLVIDNVQHEMTRHEFNHNGWELRGITLQSVAYLAAGSHAINVQWATSSGTVQCCWYNDTRRLLVIEL